MGEHNQHVVVDGLGKVERVYAQVVNQALLNEESATDLRDEAQELLDDLLEQERALREQARLQRRAGGA